MNTHAIRPIALVALALATIVAGATHAFLLTPVQTSLATVLAPINPDGSSVFKASRGVVPVKFSLAANGTPTCDLPPATIAVSRIAGGTTGAIDESEYLSAADAGSSFRISACTYVYNLAASSLGPGTYRVGISVDGLAVGQAQFTLK